MENNLSTIEVPIAAIEIGARIREQGDIDPGFIDSIQRHGIIQPLVVTTNGEGCFWLLAGWRRLRHAAAAGLETIPVHVLEPMSQLDSLEIEVSENSFRKNFTYLEKARAFEALLDRGWTQEKIAKWWSRITSHRVSRSSVAQHLKLLDLSDEAQTIARAGLLDFTSARHLAYGELAEYETEILQEAGNRFSRDGRPASWQSLARHVRQFQPDDELASQYDAAAAVSLSAIDTEDKGLAASVGLWQIERGVTALEQEAAPGADVRASLTSLVVRIQQITGDKYEHGHCD